MPWLQLEDEDLDNVQNVPATPKKATQAADLEVDTIMVVRQSIFVFARGRIGYEYIALYVYTIVEPPIKDTRGQPLY